MAEEPVEEIEALTKRIGEAIEEGASPDDLCKLAEARAGSIWPTSLTSSSSGRESTCLGSRVAGPDPPLMGCTGTKATDPSRST